MKRTEMSKEIHFESHPCLCSGTANPSDVCEKSKCGDFVHQLEPDTPAKISMCFDEPGDLAGDYAVSRIRRQFVIAKDLSEALYWKMFQKF